MARIRFDSLKFSKGLNKKFEEFVNDPKELDKAGQIITREIKADSRDGVGYDSKSFPSISSKTIKRRSALSKMNRTNRFFSATKSNITFMGDTVNGITHKVKGRYLEIFGKGRHKRIRGVRGKYLKGSNAKISDILKGLNDLGFKILGVSNKAEKRIAIQFKRWLRRNL